MTGGAQPAGRSGPDAAPAQHRGAPRPEPLEASPSSALYRGRPLRVLHGVYEIAGQGMLLARALREAGCDARCLSYKVDWDGRGGDIVVDLDRRRGEALKGAAMFTAFLRWAAFFDVFHFHFGTTILPRQWDVPLLRRLGKKIAFHFHGCDVRDRAHMLRAHRFSTCTECDPFCRPRRQRWLLEQAARYGDRVFFSTLDLAESVPGAVPLPLAVDTGRCAEAGTRLALPEPGRRDGVRGSVVIGHAPTNRLIKGTCFVVAAVERLRREFPLVELRMMERRPWAGVPEFLAGCDIVVDQLLMGWYGVLAIEGMATGRAVVLRLRDDLRGARPEPPVVNADPATLEEALRALIQDPARRSALGAAGAAFARQHHDTQVVGRQLLHIYMGLLGARAGAEA